MTYTDIYIIITNIKNRETETARPERIRARREKMSLENKQIKLDKKLEGLLMKCYFSEFVVIDGLSQHPAGLNYHQWLNKILEAVND